MKQTNGTDCGRPHLHHDKNLTILTIEGRRYTVCSHRVGQGHCGQLIDVTDGPVVYCCGIESNHGEEQEPYGFHC